MKRKTLVALTTVISATLLAGCQTVNKPIPISDSVDRSKASPWNFYEDFSSKSLASYKLTSKSGRTPREPYEFVDINGDTALSITVKHHLNQNDAKYGSHNTERAEVSMASGRNARGKEVWWGVRILAAADFEPINDRLLFTQMKHQHMNHGNPVLGLTTFENLDFKVDGLSSASSLKDVGKWYGVSYGYNNGNKYGDDLNPKEILETDEWTNVSPRWKSRFDAYTEHSELMKPAYNKKSWTTYVIGIYTNDEDSWAIVKQDGKEIFKFTGVIGDFNGYGSMVESVVRIGVYRDSNPDGEYPDQTLYFDDFAIGSSEDDVVNAMSTSCRVTTCK
jgi:hypothetical protein